MTVNLLFRIKSVKTFRCPFFGGAVEPGVSELLIKRKSSLTPVHYLDFNYFTFLLYFHLIHWFEWDDYLDILSNYTPHFKRP